MTQLSLVKKYHDDGLSAVQIFDILKEIFEDDAIPYSAITYHFRRESWILLSPIKIKEEDIPIIVLITLF